MVGNVCILRERFFSEGSFLSLADHGGFGLLDSNDAFWDSKLGVPGHEGAASTPHCRCHCPEQTFESCSPLGRVSPDVSPQRNPSEISVQDLCCPRVLLSPAWPQVGRGCWERTGEHERSHWHLSRARLLAADPVSIIC